MTSPEQVQEVQNDGVPIYKLGVQYIPSLMDNLVKHEW